MDHLNSVHQFNSSAAMPNYWIEFVKRFTIVYATSYRIPLSVNYCRTAGMYFNMVRTDLLEMCSLGPSNPPPLLLPPTTLSPYLVYYSDFNGTEKSQTK